MRLPGYLMLYEEDTPPASAEPPAEELPAEAEDTALSDLRAEQADLRSQLAAVDLALKDHITNHPTTELPPALISLTKDLEEIEAQERGPSIEHKRYRKI